MIEVLFSEKDGFLVDMIDPQAGNFIPWCLFWQQNLVVLWMIESYS